MYGLQAEFKLPRRSFFHMTVPALRQCRCLDVVSAQNRVPLPLLSNNRFQIATRQPYSRETFRAPLGSSWGDTNIQVATAKVPPRHRNETLLRALDLMSRADANVTIDQAYTRQYCWSTERFKRNLNQWWRHRCRRRMVLPHPYLTFLEHRVVPSVKRVKHSPEMTDHGRAIDAPETIPSSNSI